ncbi:phage portal protein [Candidatus Hamiltonella defensa]|uniref:phage portal protein n=1 Tax=Candidatus Williamhamiltonella defendens TaxID=138072 RepID=UPI001583605C|nr:phage portal protein [Candidatus Hamiltonella defensa]
MKKHQSPGKIKSALLNWLGVPQNVTETRSSFHDYSQSQSGQVVTADKALQLSAVWACVRLLSESISTLPLKLYHREPDGSRSLAQQHPVYNVLCRRPNLDMTPSRFMQMVVASLCLRGNAFIEKKTIGQRLIALVPRLPQNITVIRRNNGRLEYHDTENPRGDPSLKPRVIADNDMMHIRGFGLDGVCGMMPLKSGREVFGSAMSLETTAARYFQKGMSASGFVTFDKLLTREQRETFNKELERFSGSNNTGKVMLLEAGMKFNGITLDPQTSQMLESRDHSVEEICRWYRVPPFMVGHITQQSSWASSVEGMNLIFLTNTLRPLLVNIEQEIARCLLENDEDYFAEFSVEGLLRTDSNGRAAYYTTALQNGWMSRNDVRRLENLPPIEGGELYTVQLNLTPLHQLGQENDGKKARAALNAG